MRLTFPYLIGPGTWAWHHFVAERAAEFQEKGAAEASDMVVKGFAEYFKLFVTMSVGVTVTRTTTKPPRNRHDLHQHHAPSAILTRYPCPYCRHHLNEFVSVGRERDLYPVEYLFVGATAESLGGANGGVWNPVGGEGPDLLSYVKDGKSARLFVWKLHNAVSSSICEFERPLHAHPAYSVRCFRSHGHQHQAPTAPHHTNTRIVATASSPTARGEAWYHSTGSVYTNRYWPNMEGVIDNAMYRSGAVSAFRLKKICSVLEVATKLASVREKVLACDGSVEGAVDGLLATANPLIAELDEKVVASGLLQEAYGFRAGDDGALTDPNFITKYNDYFRHPEFMLA